MTRTVKYLNKTTIVGAHIFLQRILLSDKVITKVHKYISERVVFLSTLTVK